MKHRKEAEKYNIWIIGTIALMIAALGAFAAVIIYIDPMFHYHGPVEDLEYPLNDERYQNDGITRNFMYDGIITGTSMTENFKTTEADRLFGADFIKVPFSGGTYKEISSNLQRAYDAGKNVRYIIWGLDYSMLISDKDAWRDFYFPTYLYNDNLFDDLNYVLNKAMLNRAGDVVKYTAGGNKTTSFDAYKNWSEGQTFGAEAVLNMYTLGEKAETVYELTEEERKMIVENVRQNVTDLAYAHPETTFYVFFPPYSICFWDDQANRGCVERVIDSTEIAIREILKCPNIKLYSFYANFDLICDLDNYMDWIHYGEWVNSQLLEWMHDDEYLLTEDNYQEHIDVIRKFYRSYDYEQLHEQQGD